MFKSLKKVELHVHLEGSIPLEALWSLIKKYKKEDEVPSLSALEKRFVFSDFLHFLKTWIWKNQFLLELDDFTFIAEEVAKDLKKQNIIYSEMFYSPGECEDRGLDICDVTKAIRKGFEKVPGIKINLIADLIRNFGPKIGEKWLNQLKEVKDYGVIGIGIGGDEINFPAKNYKYVYEKARGFGFRTSAHAGEAAGAESIWQAINDLKVDRLGHGLNIVEDPELVSYVLEKQIPIEMCPISNIRTGVFNDQNSQHPIRELFDRGLLITVNTDDPKMFHTSLEMEYKYLMEELNFTLLEIKTLISNGVKSAWCSKEEKKLLYKQIQA